MGWALIHFGASLVWFGMFVGLFFGYEPGSFAIGCAFLCTGLSCLRSMAKEITQSV